MLQPAAGALMVMRERESLRDVSESEIQPVNQSTIGTSLIRFFVVIYAPAPFFPLSFFTSGNFSWSNNPTLFQEHFGK
jgi:hypothetical protein